MTRWLVRSETVYIIVYSKRERRRVRNKLTNNNIDLTNVKFVVRRSDDTWIRDNGPMFVIDNSGNLKVLDWGFNGWGYDAPFSYDDAIPAKAANVIGVQRIDLNDIVLEGGAVAVDGRGTLITTRSATIENGRNHGMSENEMEQYLLKYMGVSNVIWLDGQAGGNEDITDTHIDGLVHFGDDSTIVTMSRDDLIYYGLLSTDVDKLRAASDVNGNPYKFIELPLTKNDVVTTYGENLRFKGSYVNFYIANDYVLMPSYNDPNDSVAQNILQNFFTDRQVVKIDVRNLYANGGMVHCVTQQQPLA